MPRSMTVDVLDLSGSLAFVDEMYEQPSSRAFHGSPAPVSATAPRTVVPMHDL